MFVEQRLPAATIHASMKTLSPSFLFLRLLLLAPDLTVERVVALFLFNAVTFGRKKTIS